MPSSNPVSESSFGIATVTPVHSSDRSKRLRLAYRKMKKKNLNLERRITNLETQNRLLIQVCESLGDYNRYLASQALGHWATDNEAFLHYIGNGGKTHFDETHPFK